MDTQRLRDYGRVQRVEMPGRGVVLGRERAGLIGFANIAHDPRGPRGWERRLGAVRHPAEIDEHRGLAAAQHDLQALRTHLGLPIRQIVHLGAIERGTRQQHAGGDDLGERRRVGAERHRRRGFGVVDLREDVFLPVQAVELPDAERHQDRQRDQRGNGSGANLSDFERNTEHVAARIDMGRKLMC